MTKIAPAIPTLVKKSAMSARAASLVCSAVLIASFVCPSAKAATVIFSGSVASAVDDLVVDGITYDVTFSFFANTALTGDTTFDGNSTGAQTAVNELDAALNGTTASFIDLSNDGNVNQFIVQTAGFAGSGLQTTSNSVAGNWNSVGAVTLDGDTAVFEVVSTPSTPLPATLPLFASGLGALGLLGWRRKRKARVSLLGAA